MIEITQACEAKASEALGDDGYLLVSVSGGGCSGYRINLDPVLDLPEGSYPVSPRIFVDRVSAAYLDGATLDFIDDPFEPRFNLEPPEGAYSCGCGSSFSFH